MKIIVSDTYEQMSQLAADDIIAYTQSINHPLICTASGDTPAGVYKVIVDRVHSGSADVSGWFFVGLDEWVGMNGNDEGSCRFHLNNQFFQPLNIAEEKIVFFDGRTNEQEKECLRIENFVQQHGGIDVAILGLGTNGHIGMNEPGTSITSRSHVAAIDPVTQQTAQKYFKTQRQVSQGLTLGLATLLESKTIILLVSGLHKADIVKRILEEDISEQLPASLLRQHPNVKVYLDKAAAKFFNTTHL